MFKKVVSKRTSKDLEIQKRKLDLHTKRYVPLRHRTKTLKYLVSPIDDLDYIDDMMIIALIKMASDKGLEGPVKEIYWSNWG